MLTVDANMMHIPLHGFSLIHLGRSLMDFSHLLSYCLYSSSLLHSW